MELSCYIPVLVIVVAIVFGIIWAISPKAAKKLAAKTVMFIAAVVAVALILSLHGAARADEDFVDTIGNVVVDEIKQIDKEWIIPVKTKHGIICFYADSPNWKGEVYLLLFGDDLEVIDAFMINELEAPFGEFSFFILTGYSI